MIVCIIGMGSIGQRHFNNLILFKKKYKIKEIKAYENNKKKILTLRKKFKDNLITNNFKKAVFNSDVVYICSPTYLHNQSIKKTLKYASPNFYIEKPLSSKIDGCKSALRSINKKRKKIAIGYMLRHHPVISHTKKILNQDPSKQVETKRENIILGKIQIKQIKQIKQKRQRINFLTGRYSRNFY